MAESTEVMSSIGIGTCLTLWCTRLYYKQATPPSLPVRPRSLRGNTTGQTNICTIFNEHFRARLVLFGSNVVMSYSVRKFNVQYKSGLKITAGQRTMSGLIADLTGQTLILPVIFCIRTFYFPYSIVALNAL